MLNAFKYDLLWRPAYELIPALLWLIAFGYFVFQLLDPDTPRLLMLGLALFSLLMSFIRARQGQNVLVHRAALSGKPIQALSYAKLQELCRDKSQVMLGFGFEWLPHHSQRLYELTKFNLDDLVLPRWVRLMVGRSDDVKRDDEIGMPWIHGVEPDEFVMYRPLMNFEGGTCVSGTTQAGKGVFLSALISQAIYRGDAVIVIDPKNSLRLKNNIIRACQDAGRRPPLEFHPSFPDRGVRLDPMFSWQNPTELASRIQSIMPPDTSGAFSAFGWAAVNVVVQGLVELEERPNLLKLVQYIEGGVEGVLQPTLERFFDAHAPADWRELARRYVTAAREKGMKRPSETATDELMGYILYYEREVSTHQRNKIIDSQISVFRHNREHYQKITANLLPILKQLTSGTLGLSLAPDPFDPNDHRPIMSLDKVVRAGHVLHIALDSLANPAVASAIAGILLADASASAGMRYNVGDTKRRISLFVDEVSNCINRPLIELLNKGAEAKIFTTVAMQTFADISERMGSPDAARMALGNLNNLIALRAKDRETQDFITETFGKTYIKSVDVAFTSHANENLADFRAGVSKSMKMTREETIPAEILGKLPNMEFFAFVSGGRLYKGRIPYLHQPEEEWDPDELTDEPSTQPPATPEPAVGPELQAA